MYKNILVPLSFDIGKDTNQALDVAQTLCADNGKLCLFHVVEHIPQYSDKWLPENRLDIAKEVITKKMKPLIEGLEHASIEIVEGHSGRTILDFAKSHSIDCIVIASHRPGIQDFFLGSTAARVVRHAHCAVHVVR